MATARLADRQIRAAQQGALRLDVRGPVSQALARTGIVVEDEPRAAAPAPTPQTAPPTRPRAGSEAAPLVVKPFEAAPWPTRGAARDPLSGLTPDERRVHRILIDTLAIQSYSSLGDGTGVTGLSYAERKALDALDLAFIDDRLAVGAPRAKGRSHVGLIAGLVALGAGAAGAFMSGQSYLGIALLMVSIVILMADALQHKRGLPAPQRAIYEALRELALLTDPGDAASEALADADRLIDRLALDSEPVASSSSTTRRRVRS